MAEEQFLLCSTQHQQDYLIKKGNNEFIFLGIHSKDQAFFGPFLSCYYFFPLQAKIILESVAVITKILCAERNTVVINVI